MSRFLIILTVLILATGIFHACQPDDEDEKIEARKNILGTWICSESSQVYKSLSATYEVGISEDASSTNGVLISNFYQLGNSIQIKATIDEYLLDIAQQTLPGGFIVKKGSGIIADNYSEITMTYEVDDGSGQVDPVKATYVRK